MEELLLQKETFKSLKLINISHPKLKKITNSKKRIILCFISNIKQNLQKLRHLRQLSYRLHYDLILIHIEEDSLQKEHLISNLIFDKTGEIFDAYNINFIYNIEIINKFTSN